MDADNQQETTLSSIRNFYYSGFCAGEMSCSIIKAFDRSQKSYYYTPDLTITNEDIKLLQKVNKVIAQGRGIITRIKGGYNLSIRGKRKVRKALKFFEAHPIIAGEISKTKIMLLEMALRVLEKKKNCIRRSLSEKAAIEKYRLLFRNLRQGKMLSDFSDRRQFKDMAKGYFLAGVIDAEGSIGFKKSGKKKEPYFALAMKDREIVMLLKDFLGYGNVRKRRDGVYHYETNAIKTLLRFADLFSNRYPCRLCKTKRRMGELSSRILNDCTRSRKHISEDTV